MSHLPACLRISHLCMLPGRFLGRRSQIFQPLQPNKKVAAYHFPCISNAERTCPLTGLKIVRSHSVKDSAAQRRAQDHGRSLSSPRRTHPRVPGSPPSGVPSLAPLAKGSPPPAGTSRCKGGTERLEHGRNRCAARLESGAERSGRCRPMAQLREVPERSC